MEQIDTVQNNDAQQNYGNALGAQQNNVYPIKKSGHKKRENRFFDSADWAMNKQYQKSYHVSVFELNPPLYDEESSSPLNSM